MHGSSRALIEHRPHELLRGVCLFYVPKNIFMSFSTVEIPVIFASVPDLLMDIRDSFGTGTTAEILRSVQRASCLVLDDLGAERMSE